MSNFVVFVGGEQQPGMPTPFLIEAAPCEAYFVPSDDPRYPGIWYAKDPPHHLSPDGAYQRVSIHHADDYKVTLNIAPRDASLDESEWPDEYTADFYVEAIGKTDAEAKARDKAIEEVRRDNGDDCQALILVVYTKKESFS